jgi:hypothetical protein
MAKLKKAEFISGLILETTEATEFSEYRLNSNQYAKSSFAKGAQLTIVGHDKLYTQVIIFTVNQSTTQYAEHFKNLQDYPVLNSQIIPVPTQKELDGQEEKKALRKLTKEIKGNDNPNLFEKFLEKFPTHLKDKNAQKRFFLKCVQTQGMNSVNYGISQGWFNDLDLTKPLNVYGFRDFDSNLYFSLEEGNFEAAKFFMTQGESLDTLSSGKPLRYWLKSGYSHVEPQLIEQIFNYEEKLKLEKVVSEPNKTQTNYKL